MKVTHEFTHYGACPVNAAHDVYTVIVETTKMLQVEAILAEAAKLTVPLFQEDITERLAAALGCSVTTIGYHSGVKTTCCA